MIPFTIIGAIDFRGKNYYLFAPKGSPTISSHSIIVVQLKMGSSFDVKQIRVATPKKAKIIYSIFK